MNAHNELPRLQLVESDELLRELISFRLELLGYFVQCAESADAATDMARDDACDLVMVDLEMEGMDALDYIELVRKEGLNPEVPILVLSSTSDPELIRRVHSSGANAYVVMPYDPATLEHKIEQLLKSSRRVTQGTLV